MICSIPPDFKRHPELVFANSSTPPFMWHRPKELLDSLAALKIDGTGLKIGIIDDGYDLTHPHLPKPAGVRNFTNKGGPNDIVSRGQHGAHVAGIIVGLNGIGLLPKAEVYIAKGLGDDGSGATTWLNAGLRWLADQGCHFINGSYGGGGSGKEDLDTMDYCYSKGVFLLHFAAGNAGYNGRQNSIGYPANYGRCSVNGSYDADGSRSYFSSGGPKLQVLGAGGKVVSTVTGGFAAFSGTSMGSPDVAAKTGAIHSARRMAGLPDIVGYEAWGKFYEELFTAKLIKDGGTVGRDSYYGYGQLMTEAIIEYIKQPTAA